ncbi:hypothetical protein LTR04_006742, partial [Oleoguttula sp. CCFEE 6159]
RRHHNPALESLGPEAYTTHRLVTSPSLHSEWPTTDGTSLQVHATPEHLYLTTRRCFIGPIPEGWLKAHRKQWYKHYLHINHSSKAPSFSADPNVSRTRRITGLEGPSVSARYSASFPQPGDAAEEEGEEEELEDGNEEEDGVVTTTTPPALSVPRSEGPESQVFQDTERAGPGNGAAPPSTPPGRAISRPKNLFHDVGQGDGPGVSSYRTSNTVFHTPPQSSTKALARSQASPKKGRKTRTSISSFVTASEGSLNEISPGEPVEERNEGTKNSAHGYPASQGTTTPVPRNSSAVDSTDPLLGSLTENEGSAPAQPVSVPEERIPRDDKSRSKSVLSRVTKSKTSNQVTEYPAEQVRDTINADGGTAQPSAGLVRFNIPEDSPQKTELLMRARFAQMSQRRSSKILRKDRLRDGKIIKMEKMLVRVESTQQQLSDEYDENDSQKTETRTVEKWREFMVVCRESVDDDADLVLQLYKTRVIPALTDPHIKKRSKHEIPFGRRSTKVNLYSSLDKSVVIWVPWKTGTMIYILQPRSRANSVEWYTFLRNILGWHRASTLQVNVPDLSVSLRLENPFEQLEASRDLAQAAEGDDEALARTLKAEQAVAGDIIDQCIDMLEKSPEYGGIIGAWPKSERIGLAWKRYDRLEWIYGENERKMYGTIAMQKSHELELRPKEHYPTKSHTHKGKELTEPVPVEGFLIRLTSQRGVDQKMGKLFYKRLYFATHNQYLVFLRPAKASPPPPPKMPMHENSRIPSAHQIADNIPLIYAVNPYPVHDGEVSWLAEGEYVSTQDKKKYDQDAYDEAERNASILHNCDGYINLCNVVKVRKVVRGATPADETVDEGSDVDFDAEVPDTHRDDGTTGDFDDDRTFELVMNNSLVMRVQAFDKSTKREWMHRLRALVKYWKHRTAMDISLYKSVRRQNLELLKIDEETEAFMGQFARKWEVSQSFASSELYNICGISCCRAISMSGHLYRKPRRHATFTHCTVLLCHGNLLIFRDSLRTRTGKEIPHIHHDRIASIDLKECYLYSGLITENDLLHRSGGGFDGRTGRNGTARIWLEDGWTSTDEDAMCCFVVWHGQKKSFFRSFVYGDDSNTDGHSKDGATQSKENRKQRLKLVSQLGVPGRSIVFKARSRAERDHWVMNIGMEIERVKQEEDVRIVESGKS